MNGENPKSSGNIIGLTKGTMAESNVRMVKIGKVMDKLLANCFKLPASATPEGAIVV